MELVITEAGKRYPGGKQAVSAVSMSLGPGVLGLVGPNGAGKSSLMRMLATVTRPSSGKITWNGVDIASHPEQLRRTLGYLPQDFGTYPNLSAREFLTYLASAKGLSARSAASRIEQLLELVNLADVGRRPLGRFSGGMRQRVGIAQALLNDPKLLIVDEPTAGLDPEERVRFRNLLGDLAADRIVILSTHIVSDVEAVAEQIAILSHGRLQTKGSAEQLLRAVQGRVWEVLVPSTDLADLRQRHLVSRSLRTSEGVRVRVLSDTVPTHDAVAISADLEDAYLWLVDRGAPVAGMGRV